MNGLGGHGEPNESVGSDNLKKLGEPDDLNRLGGPEDSDGLGWVGLTTRTGCA